MALDDADYVSEVNRHIFNEARQRRESFQSIDLRREGVKHAYGPIFFPFFYD